jgi:quinol monooxygenase YgiN
LPVVSNQFSLFSEEGKLVIHVTAHWQTQPDAVAQVKEALGTFVAAVAQNEPRTRLYTALQETEDEARFMTYFIFEDAAARDFHRSTAWVQAFTDAIYPHNVAPVEFTEYRLIASTSE